MKMIIFLGAIIGAVMGIIVTVLTNLKKNSQNSKVKNIVFAVTNIVLGILGSIAAAQLVEYGPSILDISILPTITGGIVLSLLGTFVMKKWLNF